MPRPLLTTCRAAALAISLGAAAAAMATPVVYFTATDVADASAGVDTWQYDFVVDGTAAEFTSVNLLFDFNQFADLVPTLADPALSVLETQPDSSLGADGQLLATFSPALAGPLGFGVSFTWLGNGTPGALPFQVLDEGYSEVSTGRTRLTGSTTVPEPPMTATVLLLAMAAMAWRRRSAAQQG